MEIMNPLPPAKLDEVVDAMGDLNGTRAIDLGCGKGALIGRLNEAHAGGVGVDLSRELLDEARARAPDFELVEADITTFATSDRFDLAASIGSPATLAQLAGLVEPGGKALYGSGYWHREPDDAYLAALGATREELTDYAGTVGAGEVLGLEPRYAVTASVDDFDRYEWRWSLNGERYSAAHPDETGVDEFLAWIRNGRRRYVELGGRETLGFGLFLFERVA
jgi:SAM-dependent methyltransferase